MGALLLALAKSIYYTIIFTVANIFAIYHNS